MATLSTKSEPDCVSYIFIKPLWLYETDPRYPGDQPSMNAWVYTPGMPHFVICDSSQFAKNESSPNRMGSRLGFCGGPPL